MNALCVLTEKMILSYSFLESVFVVILDLTNTLNF